LDAEQICVEGSRFGLFARRHRELHVIDGEHGHGLILPPETQGSGAVRLRGDAERTFRVGTLRALHAHDAIATERGRAGYSEGLDVESFYRLALRSR
jgi:hypothetical protein